MHAYIHLIRGPHDPDRSPRAKMGTEGSDPTSKWRAALKKDDTAVWKAGILELLSDGRPRTFNEIGVTLLDKTADILLNLPPDRALWELVAECKIEHTLDAPIFFRVKGSTQDPSSKPGAMKKPTGKKPSATAKRVQLPADIVSESIPEAQLVRLGYTKVAENNDLASHGYAGAVWYEPATLHTILRFTPAEGDAVTVQSLEGQASLYKALGARMPPQDARLPSALGPEPLTIETAKKVLIPVDGSPSSMAAALWALSKGRDDAVLMFWPKGCAPVTRSYVAAFAENFAMPMVAGDDAKFVKSQGDGAVVVTNDMSFDDAAFLAKKFGKPVAAPFAGKGRGDVWALLDLAGLRPHPAFTVGLDDPCMPQKDMVAAAKGVKKMTREKALAQAMILSGDFPVDLLLFGDGERRDENPVTVKETAKTPPSPPPQRAPRKQQSAAEKEQKRIQKILDERAREDARRQDLINEREAKAKAERAAQEARATQAKSKHGEEFRGRFEEAHEDPQVPLFTRKPAWQFFVRLDVDTGNDDENVNDMFADWFASFARAASADPAAREVPKKMPLAEPLPVRGDAQLIRFTAPTRQALVAARKFVVFATFVWTHYASWDEEMLEDLTYGPGGLPKWNAKIWDAFRKDPRAQNPVSVSAITFGGAP